MNSILQNALNVLVIEGTARLVTGLEVEDLTETTGECCTCAEDVTAFIPSAEDKIVGIGNVEGLSVELFLLELELIGNTCSDGVRGLEIPHNLLEFIAPGKVTGSTYDTLEGLGVMSRVASDKAHTVVNSLTYILNSVIAYCVVVAMTPPHKNVCVVENLVGDTVIGIIEASEADFNVVTLAEEVSDSAVDTLGVDSCDIGIVFLVLEFVPNSNSDLFHNVNSFLKAEIGCMYLIVIR